jgi:hypothetical protein
MESKEPAAEPRYGTTLEHAEQMIDHSLQNSEYLQQQPASIKQKSGFVFHSAHTHLLHSSSPLYAKFHGV